MLALQDPTGIVPAWLNFGSFGLLCLILFWLAKSFLPDRDKRLDDKEERHRADLETWYGRTEARMDKQANEHRENMSDLLCQHGKQWESLDVRLQGVKGGLDDLGTRQIAVESHLKDIHARITHKEL